MNIVKDGKNTPINIGKEMAKKLTFAGNEFSEKLIEMGAKDVFFRLKQG